MGNLLKFTDGTEMPIGVMYCIGQNYALHAKEMGSTVPSEPIVFIKPPSSYVEDAELIKLPDFSNSIHHEVELVVVIGKGTDSEINTNYEDYIAGFAVGIDLTLRDIQKKAKEKGHPWAVAKGFYKSAPISNVVPIANTDKRTFGLELYVNNELRQKGNTKDMERDIETLIKYISKVFSLRRGDVIFTGTPEGVAEIKSGDTVVAKLDDLATINVKAE